jgi:hypothetical protein
MPTVLTALSLRTLYELESDVVHEMHRAKDFATLKQLVLEQAAINKEIAAKETRGKAATK